MPLIAVKRINRVKCGPRLVLMCGLPGPGKTARLFGRQWAESATKDRAEARLNGGKNGELVLRRYPGMSDDPIVIMNLRYFGAPRNEGFILMPNEVEAYRVGDKPFEYKGTNGFMITIDMNSKDFEAAQQKGQP